MSGDFIKVGDTFNHEGRRFWVMRICTPRSMDLSFNLVDGVTHHFNTMGSSVIHWDKVADEWAARGGLLSPYAPAVTCGRCRGSRIVLVGYASFFGPTPADCPDCGGQGRVALEDKD